MIVCSLLLIQLLCLYTTYSYSIRSNSDLRLNNEVRANRSSYLRHHWPLNGNGLDIAGGAHATNGINVGIAENRFGVPGKAVMFNYGYYTLPPAVYITQSDFTATVWVKISKAPQHMVVFDFGNGAYSDNVLFKVTSDKASPGAWIMNGAKNHYIISNTLLSLNTWHHLSFVFERDTVYIYLNGYIIAKRPSTHQARYILRNSNFIGRDSWYPKSEMFVGVMDDLRIYHYALSATEINHVMNENA